MSNQRHQASPQQRFTAKARRGYSKEFLNQVCTCGCTRVSHRERQGTCALCNRCSSFAPMAEASPARRYNFGQPHLFRLPAGLREIPEDEAIVVIPDPEAETPAVPLGVLTMTPAPAAEPEPALIRHPDKSARCPYCLTGQFESTPAVMCQNCNAWQHSACVTEANNQCSACNTPWPV
jgi:hypothetical protein